MATVAQLLQRGLGYRVSVASNASVASLADLDRKGLPYWVEVASGLSAASRAALEARGLAYFVPVTDPVSAATKASLDAQGLSYAVKAADDISAASRASLERQGVPYFVEVDSSGNSVSATPSAPVNTGLPVISGTVQVGFTLSTTDGTWTGSPTPTYTYQWKRGGVNIGSATASTYLLVTADAGAVITVTVTATNASGSASATSAGTSAVLPAAPVNSVAPVASGTTTVGSALSVTTGTWSGSPSFTYQWKRDGGNIGSATANTYTLVSGDIGAMISCAVTGTNSGGAATASSNSLGPITASGGAAVLSGASAAAFSDIFVWDQVTTDTASGTLYAVVSPAAKPAPSGAQIAAGQNGDGTTATAAANVAISSSGVKQLQLRGLTAATAYVVYTTHQTSGPTYSNVVNASFTTDVLLSSYATAGAATGITAGTGSAAFGTSQSDPYGGTNAIRWVDNNDTTTGTVGLAINTVTVFNGVTKFALSVKHQSGAAHQNMATASFTVNSGNSYWNITTGARGTTGANWGTPASFDVGGGWYMTTQQVNMAGADLSGSINLNQAAVDNNQTTIVRNGTNARLIYDIRITRAGP